MKPLKSVADLDDVVDRTERYEDVPEWGVRLRFLTPDIFAYMELSKLRTKLNLETADGLAELQVRILAATIVDEDGNRIFANEASLASLRKRDAQTLVRLAGIAGDVMGATREGVEEAEGKSEGIPGSE